MIVNLLKATYLTLLFVFIGSFSFAQSSYFNMSYGFGGGINNSYTDVYQGSIGYTTYGVFDFHITPFVTLGLEGQYGLIQGGDIETDPNNRQFVNKYTALSANVKLMLGEVVDYYQSEFLYKIRGLYAGLGIGIINNNITDIVRIKPAWAASNPGYGPFPGENKTLNMMVPLNLGFNYYINDGYGYMRYVINFNAQSTVTLGEGLDGYNDVRTQFKNFSPDIYSSFTLGFRYMLGNIKTYRRTL
ncbi:hypothetical protein SAMN05421827_103143 [Pedobacter terrae]|uniref:Outer membrane protein beta-barrel domain-containing protein n=1 Tax=Pedobacter terrae TaxID=405671 RepID=A0A1G7RBD9_9SPHI|nr:hypothetical protein [Pedobacter terrae]SDG07479.1 hypothetical protein SAMN05421827_103143 [Pedobacter terrae]